MSDGITRRDFIHDVALTGLGLGASGLAGAALARQGEGMPSAPYYPPIRTGLRGSHPGAFEAAHALAREGQTFGRGRETGENYDLVVVGAGISGLAAAYFYRQMHGPDVRILLLDNHDDFGGHARRNEFHQGGAMRLAWGGTVNMEYWKYSDVGHRLLRELGIDLERLLANFRYNWRESQTGLSFGLWCDAAKYGRDALLSEADPLLTMDPAPSRAYLEQLPISAEGREALYRFARLRRDVLAPMSEAQREEYLHRTPFDVFLREHGGLTDDAIQLYSNDQIGSWGVRTEDLSVAEALESGLPGSHLLGYASVNALEEDEGRAAMFPDGNASIARLLVRSLIPKAFPTLTAESDPFAIVTADLDYAQLDRAGAPLRLRLNSTALRAKNEDDGVAVQYYRDGQVFSVRARQCVMACYNRLIPHLCPDLPTAQAEALRHCIKRPMGTINVLLRDGQALKRSGLAGAYLPGSMLERVTLVTGIDVGAYGEAWNPADSCVLHFFFGAVPEERSGMTMVQQSQAGRERLLAMGFEDFEAEVRRVLTGVWGDSGLDVDRDILAITVNRWPHGYARDLLDLEDPAWLARPGPYEVGRQPFGQIAIANSDSGADAYTHTAIDQAWRAVNDLPAMTG